MFTFLNRYHITDFFLLLLIITLVFPEHWNSKALLICLIYVLYSFSKDFTIIIPKIGWWYIFVFVIAALSYFWSNDKVITLNATISLLPFLLFAIANNQIFNFKAIDSVLSFTAIVYALLGLLGIVLAFFRFKASGLIDTFFYHHLTAPIKANAVYIAMITAQLYLFIFYRILFKTKNNKVFDLLLASLLFGFQILLSSKMILTLSIFISLIFFINYLQKTRIKKKVLAMTLILSSSIIFLLGISSFTKNRFSNILQTNQICDVFEKQHFGFVYDWNGLTLRLFQLRCFYEIEKENSFNSYLGTGFKASQPILNEKYKYYDLYDGAGKESRDMGYYAYNFHNQYIQFIIELGLFGGLAIVFMIYAFIVYPIKQKNLLLFGVGLLFIAFALTESYLLRQKGIVSIVLFPLLAIFYKQKELESNLN